ncbi:hypothetical protein K456DRAFT_31482 [Colletotrichum gloeosporioides 23]|nr:hypothetical protein K456DRAFT_31482 [Colletotrichum gloeosporioides 23]
MLSQMLAAAPLFGRCSLAQMLSCPAQEPAQQRQRRQGRPLGDADPRRRGVGCCASLSCVSLWGPIPTPMACCSPWTFARVPQYEQGGLQNGFLKTFPRRGGCKPGASFSI